MTFGVSDGGSPSGKTTTADTIDADGDWVHFHELQIKNRPILGRFALPLLIFLNDKLCVSFVRQIRLDGFVSAAQIAPVWSLPQFVLDPVDVIAMSSHVVRDNSV